MYRTKVKRALVKVKCVKANLKLNLRLVVLEYFYFSLFCVYFLMSVIEA